MAAASAHGLTHLFILIICVSLVAAQWPMNRWTPSMIKVNPRLLTADQYFDIASDVGMFTDMLSPWNSFVYVTADQFGELGIPYNKVKADNPHLPATFADTPLENPGDYKHTREGGRGYKSPFANTGRMKSGTSNDLQHQRVQAQQEYLDQFGTENGMGGTPTPPPTKTTTVTMETRTQRLTKPYQRPFHTYPPLTTAPTVKTVQPVYSPANPLIPNHTTENNSSSGKVVGNTQKGLNIRNEINSRIPQTPQTQEIRQSNDAIRHNNDAMGQHTDAIRHIGAIRHNNDAIRHNNDAIRHNNGGLRYSIRDSIRHSQENIMVTTVPVNIGEGQKVTLKVITVSQSPETEKTSQIHITSTAIPTTITEVRNDISTNLQTVSSRAAYPSRRQPPENRRLPTASRQSLPTASRQSLPTASRQSLPTASRQSLPTASRESLPTASRQSLPTASRESLPPGDRERLSLIRRLSSARGLPGMSLGRRMSLSKELTQRRLPPNRLKGKMYAAPRIRSISGPLFSFPNLDSLNSFLAQAFTSLLQIYAKAKTKISLGSTNPSSFSRKNLLKLIARMKRSQLSTSEHSRDTPMKATRNEASVLHYPGSEASMASSKDSLNLRQTHQSRSVWPKSSHLFSNLNKTHSPEASQIEHLNQFKTPVSSKRMQASPIGNGHDVNLEGQGQVQGHGHGQDHYLDINKAKQIPSITQGQYIGDRQSNRIRHGQSNGNRVYLFHRFKQPLNYFGAQTRAPDGINISDYQNQTERWLQEMYNRERLIRPRVSLPFTTTKPQLESTLPRTQKSIQTSKAPSPDLYPIKSLMRTVPPAPLKNGTLLKRAADKRHSSRRNYLMNKLKLISSFRQAAARKGDNLNPTRGITNPSPSVL